MNFTELCRVFSTANLVRRTGEYHSALRAAWDRECPDAPFMVSTAEKLFKEVCYFYKPQLDYFTSPELKQRMRQAADLHQVRAVPGVWSVLRTCEFTPESKKDAYGLALICKAFCGSSGVGVRIVEEEWAFIVKAETNSLGICALTYKSGCRITTLREFCFQSRFSFGAIFWWLSMAGPLKPGDQINPVCRCLNTPDVEKIAKSLIFR